MIELESSPLMLRHRPQGRAKTRDKGAAIAAILSAAEAEFAHYGLLGARVEAIAKAAGVTKGLVFHYFESKENLFEEVLRLANEPLQAVLAEAESSSAPPPELLRLLVDRFLHVVREHPIPHLIYIRESIQNNGVHYRKLKVPSLYEAIERVLDKGVKQGYFRKLDVAHAAINIVGLCVFYFCAANNHSEPNLTDPFDERSMERHAKEVFRFIEAGTSAN